MQAWRERALSIALISPSLLAIAIFVYGFIGWTARVSLSSWQGLIPDYSWVGLTNYLRLIADRRFQIDMRNTAIFTLLFLGVCLLLGLLLAMLLDRGVRGEGIFRGIYLFPMAVSFIVTGVAWRWLMNPASGTRMSGLNALFDRLGLDFLINSWHTTDPPWGIAFIVIPAVWQMSGFTMALYLAGLRGVPEEMREAARVDGANELQIYQHIILPLLRPVTLSAVVILGHISLKVFDLVVAISGKDIRLDVPSIYMWTTTFDANNFARGAAIAMVMLLTVAVLVVPYLVSSIRSEAEV